MANQGIKIEGMEKIIKQYTEGNDLSYVSASSRNQVGTFVYQGSKGEDPYSVKTQLSQEDGPQHRIDQKKFGTPGQGNEELDTGTDDHKIDDGLEDAEILDDDEDMGEV